jgi:putative transposase
MIRSWKSNLTTTSYSCNYYVVRCPKYRRKVLTDNVAVRLKELIRNICLERQSELPELGIMPDHVHQKVSQR